MLGKNTNEIKAYRHDLIDTYGCSRSRDHRYLNTVIRQASLSGYLARDIENYGLVRLTPAGRAFLENPQSFKIVEDTDFTDDDETLLFKSGAGCSADPELYAILDSMRKQIAAKLKLPPYVIFQDPSLEAMATSYPVTLEELQNISGVGAGKAKRYGDEFVKVIKAYVDEREIERPEDLRVRSVANRSKSKISIIQAIDRKIDLEELAPSLNMNFDQLLEEIEAIVNSGTKINISYYLDNLIDTEDQEEIFDYFRESTSDSLSAAYDELCPDYSENEIRLVRIRFLSEMGN